MEAMQMDAPFSIGRSGSVLPSIGRRVKGKLYMTDSIHKDMERANNRKTKLRDSGFLVVTRRAIIRGKDSGIVLLKRHKKHPILRAILS